MTTPSEEIFLEKVVKAERSIANAIVTQFENKYKADLSKLPFRQRLSPTNNGYKNGKSGLGGYNPRDIDSIKVFNKAASHFIGEDTKACYTSALGGMKAISTFHVTEKAILYSYKVLGKQPPLQTDTLVKNSLAQLKETNKGKVVWVEKWIISQEERQGFSRTQVKDLKELCTAFNIYVQSPIPISRRELSVKAFNDSKYFENKVQRSFIKIAQQQGILNTQDDVGTALERLGIETNPKYALISGQNCELCFEKSSIKLEVAQSDGLHLSKDTISRITKLINLDNCLVIENETNFHEIGKQDFKNTLLVFGGGQVNSAVLSLLRFIESKGIPIYAWSDIDLGGFQIVEHLIENIPSVQPILMGVDSFDYCVTNELTFKRTKAYKKLLLQYIKNHPNSRFIPVAEKCCKQNVTVEQESMLTTYFFNILHSKLIYKTNPRY